MRKRLNIKGNNRNKVFAAVSVVLLSVLMFCVCLLQSVTALAAPSSIALSFNIDHDEISREIAVEHENFQAINGGDRTSFNYPSFDYSTGTGIKKGEQIAADYIIKRLESFGYGESDDAGDSTVNASAGPGDTDEGDADGTADESSGGLSSQIILETFSEVFTENSYSLFSSAEEYTIWSQNVILRLTNPDAAKQRVIIGASIDNDFEEGEGKAKSSGAIQSGSGVATLLTIAKMLKGESLPYSVDIVFFGASRYGGTQFNIGSDYYCTKNSFGNMILMVNIGRLGGETTYVYSDEVKTKLLSHALTLGGFKALPYSVPILEAGELGGPDSLTYAHVGMLGAHARFMQRGIPVLNFFCGDYGGLILADREGSANILGKDTIENMLAAYPDAYDKMADTLVAVLSLVSDESLADVVQSSQAARFDYEVFTKRWIAYLIMAGVVIIGFVVLVFVAKSLAAKYPPKKMEKSHVSVFGNEYDNKF